MGRIVNWSSCAQLPAFTIIKTWPVYFLSTLTSLSHLKKNPVIFSFYPQILPYLLLKDIFKCNYCCITNKNINSNSLISSNVHLRFERQSSYIQKHLWKLESVVKKKKSVVNIKWSHLVCWTMVGYVLFLKLLVVILVFTVLSKRDQQCGKGECGGESINLDSNPKLH